MEEEVKSGKNAPEQTTVSAHPISEKTETNEEYNQRLRDRLNEEKNSTLIKYERLIEIAPEFAIWLKEIVRYGNVDSQVLISMKCEDDGRTAFNCNIYTETHCYRIYGNKPYGNSKRKFNGHLGCIGSTRKNRVGEDWNRGNDLPDGKYSKKTFNSIVKRIVAYELKSLQLWR